MKIIGFIIISGVATGLSGCGYIQTLFPDKERDYQYTTEIPLINYPTELRKNQSDGSNPTDKATETPPPSSNGESSETVAGAENAEQPSGDINSPENPPEDQPVPKPETSSTEVTPADGSDERDTVSTVEIIKYDDGESRLRLGAGYSKSWRVVNKALSRNTIEITERNNDKAQITVQYDPDEKKAKDDSFLDEISFLFKGINTNDKQYVLKLEEHEQHTDVIVLNEEHLAMLNDEAALRLLKLLADTIKADLAGKENVDKPVN
jgi:outer membrane protein assembly factor BamC